MRFVFLLLPPATKSIPCQNKRNVNWEFWMVRDYGKRIDRLMALDQSIPWLLLLLLLLLLKVILLPAAARVVGIMDGLYTILLCSHLQFNPRVFCKGILRWPGGLRHILNAHLFSSTWNLMCSSLVVGYSGPIQNWQAYLHWPDHYRATRFGPSYPHSAEVQNNVESKPKPAYYRPHPSFRASNLGRPTLHSHNLGWTS